MTTHSLSLRLTHGPREGEIIPLADERIELGRLKKNTICIDDPTISKHHLTFLVEEDRVFVEDAGSSYGTQVNGTKIKSRLEIKEGDLLQFGDQHAELVSLSSDAADDKTMFVNPEAVQAELESGARRHRDAGAADADGADRTRILNEDGTREITSEELASLLGSSQGSGKSWYLPIAAVVMAVQLVVLLLLVWFHWTSETGRARGGWEYRTLALPENAEALDGEWDNLLNAMGREGWELSREVGRPGETDDAPLQILIFKRRRP